MIKAAGSHDMTHHKPEHLHTDAIIGLNATEIGHLAAGQTYAIGLDFAGYPELRVLLTGGETDDDIVATIRRSG